MGRTRVKICGIRDLDAAEAAAASGADAIGFVFVRSSPRFVEPADAWRIAGTLPPFVATVGVFVDATVDAYSDVEEVCPTDFGQLHGDEDEETVRRCGPRIIKAIRFDPNTIERELRRWSAVEEVDAILVDAAAPGSGRAIDWSALAHARASCSKPLVLAGGLTAENVAEAIRVVRPYAVDVSSGVERAVGEKDPALIRAFCRAVRRADASLV